MSETLRDRAARAIQAGAEELFRRRRPDGAFVDSPPGSVLGTAGAITALHAADPIGAADLIAKGAHWLRQSQLDDGGWSGVVGGDAEPVATAIALSALHITSPAESATAVETAQRRLATLPPVTDASVAHVCQQFLALAGFVDPATLRRLPLALVLFDRLRRQRISFRTTPFVALALLQAAAHPGGPLLRVTTRLAQPAALRLLRTVHEHERRTGAFSEDPYPAALVCLGLARAGLAPDLVTAITGFLRRAVRPDGCWDAVTNLDLTRSAYAATGLVAAGYAADPRLAATRDLFHRCQQQEPFTVFDCPGGGWSYSGPHGWPVTLESAEILAALSGLARPEGDAVLRQGLGWLTARQDTRGSWSLWVRDTKLAIDGPCPGITSQGITALVENGHRPESGPVAAAARWLLTQQRPDGTFENLWYRDFTSGTSAVLAALCLAGHAADPVAGRATAWLLRTQCGDGSWGPGDGSAGSVEETAWAVHALLTSGVPATSEAIRRGVSFLVDAQQDDGAWQPSRVCVYIRRHMHYPNGVVTRGLALRALAAFRDADQELAA